MTCGGEESGVALGVFVVSGGCEKGRLNLHLHLHLFFSFRRVFCTAFSCYSIGFILILSTSLPLCTTPDASPRH